MSTVLQTKSVSKQFGKTQALSDVDFEVEKGEVHALVGENGAGKTTLMRILYGGERPSSGTVVFEGSERKWRNSAEAISHGIGMVSQHYSVIPELSCIENLVLGAEGGAILPWSVHKKRAGELARSMGLEFEWDSLAQSLGPSATQRLEILKLLWRSSRLMILDEPTAMLSPQDASALYEFLKELARTGKTVIVVTHKIAEVMDHCDTVTVLRGGKFVARTKVSDTTAGALAEMIVGKPLRETSKEPVPPGSPVLTLRKVVVLGSRKNRAVNGVDLEVRAGEVVGIAGVDGNGQRELFQALIGATKFHEGTMTLAGAPATEVATSKRIALGVRLIPEDRHAQGVIDDWKLTDNSILGLHRLHGVSQGRWIDEAAREAAVERVAGRFETKHSGFDCLMRDLSGGNQQKFVAARAFEQEPRLFLAFQPTRGLDIDATRRVFAEIRSLCARGGAASLVVSFDLDELLEFCDRIVVMHGGKLVEPESGEEFDRLAIGRLMVGTT